MKEQFFPSAERLKEDLALKKVKDQAWLQKTGILTAVEHLSRAIKDLRDSGVDVQLQLMGNASEDVFSLVKTAGSLKDKAIIVPISGTLEIVKVRHLLGICVKEGEDAVLKIYVSQFDYRGNGANTALRGECFDLKADPEAIYKLQKNILFTAARNEIVRGHDICDIFERDRPITLDKSAPKQPRL